MIRIPRRALLLTAPALLVPNVVRASLAVTPRATEGPFYPTRVPADDDNDLIHDADAVRRAGGDILYLKGTVLDRNASAIGGARIEIWQCDMHGIYLHPGDRRSDRHSKAFQGFGHATADETGRFTFRTIVPVPYTGRTPHIHLKVWSDGEELLTTQLYRAGYPQNADDFLFRRLSPEEQERVSMVMRNEREKAAAYRTDVRIVLAA